MKFGEVKVDKSHPEYNLISFIHNFLDYDSITSRYKIRAFVFAHIASWKKDKLRMGITPYDNFIIDDNIVLRYTRQYYCNFNWNTTSITDELFYKLETLDLLFNKEV